jgi:hypothetical protein
LKAGDVFGKIANLDASTKSSLVEAFKQISQPDNRAAALDIALFHLCLLDQNGTFKNMDDPKHKGKWVMDAYRMTVEKAMTMSK